MKTLRFIGITISGIFIFPIILGISIYFGLCEMWMSLKDFYSEKYLYNEIDK